MKLFLATFKLEHNAYMGRTKVDKETSVRLVWAETEEEAEEKLNATLCIPASPGGDSRYLLEVEINEAIM
jgi:hypothetical protein